MATPRVKRPYAGMASDPAQRQITSFFATGTQPDRERSHSSDGTSSPVLPPSVQANLLAVGMRVRKSVPEGYKTGKDLDGALEQTTSRKPAPTSHRPFSDNINDSSPSRNYTCNVPAQRELLPFCGLHKVGGLGVQHGDDGGRPMFSSSLFSGMDDDETPGVSGSADEPPSLTSSQETVSSTASSYSSSYYNPPSRQSRFPTGFETAANTQSTKKRVYGDEQADAAGSPYSSYSSGLFQVHEDVHGRHREAPATYSAASSSSINSWLTSSGGAPQTTSAFYQLGRRVLAVPRRRQQRSPSLQQQQLQGDAQASPDPYKATDGQHGGVRILDQENLQVLDGGDFDEADFLDASMLAEGSGDMEMSGM